jgi:hypothetical protein
LTYWCGQRLTQRHPRQGLFISKKLTNLLGGKPIFSLSVDNAQVYNIDLTGDIILKSKPGFGSTFTFFVRAELSACPPEVSCLPDVPSSKGTSSPSEARTSGAQAKLPTPGRKLRVLLTEDNLINQQLLQRQLTKAGCSVAVANNGQEALDLVVEGESNLDCILMGMFAVSHPENE